MSTSHLLPRANTQTSELLSQKIRQSLESEPLDIDKLTKVCESTAKVVIWNDKGKPVFWNTVDDLSEISSSSTNQQLSIGKYRAYFTTTIDHHSTNEQQSLQWLSLILLIYIVGYAARHYWRGAGATRKSRYLYLTAGSILILTSKYLHLPAIINDSISGSTSISILQIFLIFIFCGHVAPPLSRALDRVLEPQSIVRSMIVGSITSMFFALHTYIISISASSSYYARGLDHPLNYYGEGILLLCLYLGTALCVYHICLTVYRQLLTSLDSRAKFTGLIVGFGIVGISLYLTDLLGLPLLAFFAFVLSYLLILDIFLDQRARSAAFLFLWLIIYSGLIASCVFHYQLKEDATDRTAFAQTLYYPLLEKDKVQVAALDQTLKNSNTFGQLANLLYPAKLDIEDFNGFLIGKIPSLANKPYRLECYGGANASIFKNHYSSKADLERSLLNSERLSEHIYYNPLKGSYTLRYFVENNTFPDDRIELAITILTGDGVTKNHNYQYAISVNRKIIAANTDSPILQNLAVEDTKNDNGIKGDLRYTIYKPTSTVQVAVIRDLDGLLKPISLFSFVLTLAGIILLLLTLLNTKVQILPKDLDIALDYSASLKNKIQFTVVSLTVFSFILIGLMTVIYFRNVLQEQATNEKRTEIDAIVNNVYSTIAGTADAQGMQSVLLSELDKIAHIHQKPLALYDNQGRLVRSTSSNLQKPRIPFSVYRSIQRNENYTHLHEEIEDRSYVHFVPMLYNKQSFGVLGIPESHSIASSQSLLDFLSTILNVYIFLFLVAGAIAIAISNSITRPLSFLNEKLRLFRLGKNQEPLQWHSKDEIGSLIKNYNELVIKLEESANIISKTERDTAWKEMAKQVAHEIKNPLTPMKLSIQHLERLSRADHQDVHSMVSRISKTLLEQFNNLDNIANSFSNFASMPTADNEKIIINEVVESIHDLFRKREDMDITLSEPIDDLYIYADRNHLVRVLNNIVKNAIQAIPEDRKGRINLSLAQVGQSAVVKVSDNGIGIPDHMKDKVFTPKFTTKSSGTGLGLAISANMIEAFNGKIYFKTQEGVGTDFYIEIPLMRVEDHLQHTKRVTL